MRRAPAQIALDEAFADGVKKLFGVLVSNLMAGEDAPGSIRRFSAGITFHDDAHSKATAEIEKIFPE